MKYFVILVLQVVVGVLFLIIGTLDINKENQQRTADVLNDVVVIIIFVISVINIIISLFGIQHVDLSAFSIKHSANITISAG